MDEDQGAFPMDEDQGAFPMDEDQVPASAPGLSESPAEEVQPETVVQVSLN